MRYVSFLLYYNLWPLKYNDPLCLQKYSHTIMQVNSIYGGFMEYFLKLFLDNKVIFFL